MCYKYIQVSKAERLKPKDIVFFISIQFLSLSYRSTTAKVLKVDLRIKHVSIWKWIQKCKPKKILSKRKLMNISLMKLQSR